MWIFYFFSTASSHLNNLLDSHYPCCVLSGQCSSLRYGVLSQNPSLVVGDNLNQDNLYGCPNIICLNYPALCPTHSLRRTTQFCLVSPIYKLSEKITVCRNTMGILKNLASNSLKHLYSYCQVFIFRTLVLEHPSPQTAGMSSSWVINAQILQIFWVFILIQGCRFLFFSLLFSFSMSLELQWFLLVPKSLDGSFQIAESSAHLSLENKDWLFSSMLTPWVF